MVGEPVEEALAGTAEVRDEPDESVESKEEDTAAVDTRGVDEVASSASRV